MALSLEQDSPIKTNQETNLKIHTNTSLTAEEAAIVDYENVVNSHPLLNAEQEKDLISIIQTQRPLRSFLVKNINNLSQAKELKDALLLSELMQRNSRNLLIGCNLRLVHSRVERFCKKFHKARKHIPELQQEGILALEMEAIDRYDSTRKTAFSTYAVHWIDKFIKVYMATVEPIPLTDEVVDGIRKLKRTRTNLARELGQPPTAEQLIEATGFRSHTMLKRVEEAARLRTISLYRTINTEEQTTKGAELLHQTIPDTNNGEDSDLKVAVQSLVLENLNEREQKLLELKYGIGANEPVERTNSEVAEIMEMSPQNVQRIEREDIFQKLKSANIEELY